jgi:hypothetical protein
MKIAANDSLSPDFHMPLIDYAQSNSLEIIYERTISQALLVGFRL